MNRREFMALGPAFPASAVTASLTIREQDKPDIELGVQTLKLQKGDSIVLTHPGHLDHATADRIRAYMESQFPGVTAVVFADGLKIEGVLRGPA